MQFPTLRLGVRDLTPTSLRRRLLVGAALVILIAFATAGCSPAHLYSASAGFNRPDTITVQASGAEASAAVAWWNSLAGRQLFAADHRTCADHDPDRHRLLWSHHQRTRGLHDGAAHLGRVRRPAHLLLRLLRGLRQRRRRHLLAGVRPRARPLSRLPARHGSRVDHEPSPHCEQRLGPIDARRRRLPMRKRGLSAHASSSTKAGVRRSTLGSAPGDAGHDGDLGVELACPGAGSDDVEIGRVHAGDGMQREPGRTVVLHRIVRIPGRDRRRVVTRAHVECAECRRSSTPGRAQRARAVPIRARPPGDVRPLTGRDGRRRRCPSRCRSPRAIRPARPFGATRPARRPDRWSIAARARCARGRPHGLARAASPRRRAGPGRGCGAAALRRA